MAGPAPISTLARSRLARGSPPRKAATDISSRIRSGDEHELIGVCVSVDQSIGNGANRSLADASSSEGSCPSVVSFG